MYEEYHYQHSDPASPFYPQWPPAPAPSDGPDQDRIGCIASIVSWIITLILLCALCAFTGCTSPRTIASDTSEHHHVENLMQHMDSLFRLRTVERQDSSFRESVLHQLQTLSERNDTSHTIVTDTAGRIIKETLIIRQERATTSETDRRERELLVHRLTAMDSTISVMRQQLFHADSLLQQSHDTEVLQVPAPLTPWQQFRLHLANIMLILLALAAAIWVLKNRAS